MSCQSSVPVSELGGGSEKSEPAITKLLGEISRSSNGDSDERKLCASCCRNSSAVVVAVSSLMPERKPSWRPPVDAGDAQNVALMFWRENYVWDSRFFSARRSSNHQPERRSQARIATIRALGGRGALTGR